MPPLTREALDIRLLAWTRGEQGDDTFEAVILDVYRYQYAHNAAYRRWCDQRQAAPATVRRWQEIPAVPQAAFKEWTLASVDPTAAVARFDSSGTTEGRPSCHYFDTLALYDAAVVTGFRAFVLPDQAQLSCLALVPDPAAAPHSSLAHMAGVVARECCDGQVGYFVCGSRVETKSFLRACEDAHAPVLIFTTAFALVHVLDTMAQARTRVALPPGSRMMETGGYKGRTREVPKVDLYASVADAFGIPPTHIVNEYSMAELSSQWYDTILRDTLAGRPSGARRKAGPPWARARILDPRTGADARPGDVGLIRLYDPMNRGSVCCIQTEDLGHQYDDGFDVLGRATDAELRGCSLELDTFE